MGKESKRRTISDLVVLHVAYIERNEIGGVAFSVPGHVRSQETKCRTALLNTAREPHPMSFSNAKYVCMSSGLALERLEAPFDDPDIVVFHELYRPSYLAFSRRLLSKEIPYLVVPHGCLTEYAQSKKWLKKKMANALLFKRFLFAADRIHYLTEKEKERSAFDLPCFIAPNGTDARFEKRRFSETGCLASYIGRLDVEIKGIDLLLDALHLVRDELVNLGFSMSMYGPGDHEGILDMVRDRGLGGVVRVYGPIFGDAKKDVLSSSDLFIQASRSEGLPMGLIEAMATGLPCLVTEGTGMGSLLVDHDAGWCCETTADAIAEALLEVLSLRGEWERVSVSAASLAERLYSWDAVSNVLLDEYAQVAFGASWCQ